jgi:DNA invertase Pin-like site-specific DNA recombinase
MALAYTGSRPHRLQNTYKREDLTMQPAIGYLRVSTREQGRSGLGLAAQRHEIKAFGEREGFAIKSWHQDIQTGAGTDALLLRPGLAGALKEARAARCALIVSRLDRLSRNVHFITGLMEHKVHFVVAALGKDCDEFTLHIYASLAEQERKMISERTRAGMAAAARRGRRFGLSDRSREWQQHLSAIANAARQEAADQRAEAYRPDIEWAFRQPGAYGRPISFRAAAITLTERKIGGPRGGVLTGETLRLMTRRLGLTPQPARLPPGVARDRVREVWVRHPHFILRQVENQLGPKFPLGETVLGRLLNEQRRAAARQSPLYERIGWRLDCRTVARIRISEIWKRHPEYTARQVITRLKPTYPIRVHWVQKVLRECWRAHVRVSARQLRIGRRSPSSRIFQGAGKTARAGRGRPEP